MGKILTSEKLTDQLYRERQIIFTHGSFDLFHIGHLELLKRSKALGGKLVVGVDSNDSVRSYKRKPFITQEYRMKIISKLDFVDYVLPLDQINEKEELELYYIRLYLALKPDVITYGGNFPFVKEVMNKCHMVGIRNKQIIHEYSHIKTSGYIKNIIARYLESGSAEGMETIPVELETKEDGAKKI